MQFALTLSWWTFGLVVLALACVAWSAYVAPVVPLSKSRRALLMALRAGVLLVVLWCVLRPVRVLPPETTRDAVVPVLVDASRSMRIPDAGGRPRIAVARDIVEGRLRTRLSQRFQTDVWTFGETLAPASDGVYAPEGRRSDLIAALRALRERYKDRRVPAVVVISDGGDTGAEEASRTSGMEVPVYTIGVGSAARAADLEVLDVSAGEATFANSSIDLTVTAVSHGAARPFDVRVLENGRPIDVRRMTPTASDSPLRAVFTVAPSSDAPTVYTAEIPPAQGGELVAENNTRSVLVEPAGRRRRLLIVEGAPGFEHAFLKRALDADQGLDVDAVVRKGRDARGAATFFVQAGEDRVPTLTSGFAADRAALYRYDAVILANADADAMPRQQLEMLTNFVAERGGGLLVLGAKSFERQALVGTPLEEVLPIELSDRGNGVVHASLRGDRYTVAVTSEGAVHPVTRVGVTAEQSDRLWNGLPPLAGAALLGAPRPGAQVLAVVQAEDGPRPLVAVQRYGEGRSMIFTGEASWRWRMQLPTDNHVYESFWRLVVRWLASSARDPVSIGNLPALVPGDTGNVDVVVRDREFNAVSNAQVTVRVTVPGGEAREAVAAVGDSKAGHYVAPVVFERPGVYHVSADARQGVATLGSGSRWMLVGGVDAEMTDPRLNEEVLRRVSRASGGQYVTANEAMRVADLLFESRSEPGPPRVVELWHSPWVFTTVIVLLALEWMFRRTWGLR